MLRAFGWAASLSALIATVIFTILRILEAIVPSWFHSPVDWWLLGLLFAVGFVPRAIMIVVDWAIAYRKADRGNRRKT